MPSNIYIISNKLRLTFAIAIISIQINLNFPHIKELYKRMSLIILLNNYLVPVLLLGCLGGAATAGGSDLPSDFMRCRQKGEDLNPCLKRSVPDALRKMKNGIAHLAVKPLEPLTVATLNIESGVGPVRIAQYYKDIKLHGLTDSILLNYDADLKNYRLTTDSYTPQLQFLADYIMDGRILILPIQGKGKANLTMDGLKVHHEILGEPIKKDGQLYMKIKDYKVRFTPKRVHLYFSNLFNGDKLLGEQMNRFLNEQWELVFNELKPSYEKTFSHVFKDVSNKIFTKVPFNKIFLED